MPRLPSFVALLSSAAVVAAAPAGCQRTPAPTTPRNAPSVSTPAPVTRLYGAQVSAYATAEEAVIRDQSAWQGAWRQLHNGLAAAPVPAVDFAREVVVLVAAGERNTGGTTLRVDDVVQVGADAVVRYTVTEPGPGCMTAQVITSPVEVVRVPQAGGAVRFERRTTVTPC